MGHCNRRKGGANYEIQVEGIAGHHGNASRLNKCYYGNWAIKLACYTMASVSSDPNQFTREKLKEQGIQDHGQFTPENTINVGVIGSTNQKINSIRKMLLRKSMFVVLALPNNNALTQEIKTFPIRL